MISNTDEVPPWNILSLSQGERKDQFMDVKYNFAEFLEVQNVQILSNIIWGYLIQNKQK